MNKYCFYFISRLISLLTEISPFVAESHSIVRGIMLASDVAARLLIMKIFAIYRQSGPFISTALEFRRRLLMQYHCQLLTIPLWSDMARPPDGRHMRSCTDPLRSQPVLLADLTSIEFGLRAIGAMCAAEK